MLKFYALFFILIITGIAQNILTAEDAVKIGLKNNYDIQIARNNQEIADNNSSLGTAGFLPSLNATGNYQLSKSEQETNSPFSFGNSDTRNANGQISLNWTLFDGFKMFIDNSKYKELAKLGEFRSRNIVENMVVSILRAYFNVVQQQQLLDVAKSSLAISKTRLEKQQVKKEFGGASSTDLLNARVSFNNDKSVLLNQELQIYIAKKNLNILLGQDPEFQFTVNNEIIVHLYNLNYSEVFEIAKEKNSTYLIARQNKILADKNVGLSKSVYSPNLALNANYGYTDRLVSSDSPQFTRDIETKSTDGSVGLTLTFNLFNGFRDNLNYQNARLEAKNQQLAMEQSLKELEGLVREKYISFENKFKIVNLEEQNVSAAKQNLQLLQDLFNVGAASSLEFRDAQINLARNQANLISAKFQAKLLRIELNQLAGLLTIE